MEKGFPKVAKYGLYNTAVAQSLVNEYFNYLKSVKSEYVLSGAGRVERTFLVALLVLGFYIFV